MPGTRIKHIFFFALLLLTTLAFAWLIHDFLLPVFWAVVLAILFYPLYRRWLKWLKHRAALASVATLITLVLIGAVPLMLVGAAVTREALGLYQQISSGTIDIREPVRQIERMLPAATDLMDRFGVEIDQFKENLSNAAVTASQFIASQLLSFGQDALRVGALFFLMLYVLFFFFRDGERLVDLIVRALPLGDEQERQLFAKFATVARATIKGTLVVGLVQGTLGGLLFWILGISAPVFWGVVMTFLSFLPAVGSALVWGPAAIILLATGQVMEGIIMIVAGTLLISMVDNILRPLLVGRDTQMPDYLVLLSTLGGLALFDLSGFVIGPVIAALFLAVWDMFIREYGESDDDVMLPPPEPVPAAEPSLSE